MVVLLKLSRTRCGALGRCHLYTLMKYSDHILWKIMQHFGCNKALFNVQNWQVLDCSNGYAEVSSALIAKDVEVMFGFNFSTVKSFTSSLICEYRQTFLADGKAAKDH